MPGPRTKRLNPASQPSLTQPGLDLLSQIFGGGSSPIDMRGRGSIGGLFQQMGGGPTQRNPLAEGGDIMSRLNTVFGQSPFIGEAGAALRGLSQDPTEAGLLGAYEPIFQRNLARAANVGPRFSSGNDQLRGQALQDYNLFAQQAIESARNRQLQAALGFGQFGLGAQGQQQQILEQLLGALFKGGGINAEPVYQQGGGGFGNFLGGALGTLGGAFLGPLGAAAGGALGGKLFGGGGPQQYSGDPFNPFGR